MSKTVSKKRKTLPSRAKYPETPSAYLDDRPATRGMLKEMEHALKNEISGVRSEVESVRAEVGSVRADLAGFRSEVDSKFHTLIALVHDIKKSVHLQNVRYEAMYSDHRWVLEQTSNVGQRQERQDKRMDSLEAEFRSFMRAVKE